MSMTSLARSLPLLTLCVTAFALAYKWVGALCRYCGSNFHDRSPTDFECQEVHRLITLLKLFTNPSAFPRMNAAACRTAPDLITAVGTAVLETRAVNPLVVVLWSQVVSDLQWDVTSWWALCGLGDSPGVLTVNQHICQLSMFLLECHKTALGLRSGIPDRVRVLTADQLNKPPSWYALLAKNARESPVLGVATGICAGSSANAFLAHLTRVLDASFIENRTPTQQRDLVRFFKALPPSLMVVRMLMSLVMPCVAPPALFRCVGLLMPCLLRRLFHYFYRRCTALDDCAHTSIYDAVQVRADGSEDAR